MQDGACAVARGTRRGGIVEEAGEIKSKNNVPGIPQEPRGFAASGSSSRPC